MTTYQTAVRLKDAWFPQPEIALSQWWYDPFGRPLIANRSNRLIELPDPDRSLFLEDTAGFCYAPTAAEILPLLPGVCIAFEKGRFFAWTPADAKKPVWATDAVIWGESDDLDEALALAWLKKIMPR